ncbi:MAG TPA: MutS family DNA mismatch repair protein [Rhodothermales bacterium]
MDESHKLLRDGLLRYEERLTRRIDVLRALSRRMSTIRLMVVLVGVALTYATYRLGGDTAGGIVLLALIVGFVALARVHGRLERSRERHLAWRAIKRTHRARLELDWQELPPSIVQVPNFEHPFEADLNLTGERSLLRLLDTTVTLGGHKRLLAWIRETTLEPDTVKRRQALVKSLRGSSLFRDRLHLETTLLEREGGSREEMDLLQRVNWRTDAPTGTTLGVLGALAAVNWVFVGLDIADVLDLAWVVSFPVYGLAYLTQYRRLVGLFDRAEELYYALQRFATVFRVVERHRFSQEEVRSLVAPLQDPAERPSRLLARSARVAAAAGTQKSEVLTLVLNVIGPWDLFFAHRLEAVKERLRARLPAWLDVMHELEALNALAAYAAWHPEAAFPELMEGDDAPLLEGTAFAHPLIAADQKVRNDFTLGREGEICLLTGSNMSGKSTFLRTIGINLVLAGLGAPVDAAAMRWRPVRLFTCLQVSDSVNDGISYFYAEVRRLRALLGSVRADASTPLVFLIDEIFRGTNNRERLIGSRAYVRSIARERAAGLIATHDLDLVALEQEIPGLRNLHFREEVRDGRMVFDYRLRAGPSPTTNALQIMRMEGLPVDDP